jgi:hypothetical protein
MPDPASIALWGPSASGKTVFLAQLYLKQDTQDEWEVKPSRESEEVILQTDKFIKESSERIRANRFPLATDPGATSKVRYHFEHKQKRTQGKLFVEDRSGKEWENLVEQSKQELLNASGIVLLLDPDKDSNRLKGQIEATLRQLHNSSQRDTPKDDRPVAVCLSKTDQLIKTPEDLFRAQSEPRKFVLEKIKAEIQIWISIYCANFELFAISSVGVRLCHGTVQPLMFYDEEMEARICSNARPINLMSPFAWLFEQIEKRKKETAA